MKKILFSFVLIAMCAAAFTQNLKGKRIAVVEPKMQNFSDSEKWVALFIQSQVTANFQNYSGMTVIDRQNQDKAIKEQKLSVSAAYDEDEQIEIGKLLSAHYIVVISIIKKGSGYAIDAKINDSKTNQTVGKAYSNPNCSAAELENSAIYEMSYQLLSGIGVDSKTLSDLRKSAKNEAQKKEVSANANFAKGLAIEKSNNGSIVEAMAYYQKAVSDSSKMTEAATRLNKITSGLSAGNIREQSLNEIALRKEWLKIWDDYHRWAAENYYLEIVYSTALIKKGDVNFETERVNIEVPVAIMVECEQMNRLYAQLESAYLSLPFNVSKWNIDTSRLPKKYFRVGGPYPFSLICSIYDESGAKIGSVKLTSSFTASNNIYENGYLNRYSSYCDSLYYENSREAKSSYSRDNKKSDLGVDAYIINVPCKAETITDKISVQFAVKGVSSLVKLDNRKSNHDDAINVSGMFSYSYGSKKYDASAIIKGNGGWRTGNAEWTGEEFLYYVPEYFTLRLNREDSVCQRTMLTDGKYGRFKDGVYSWEGGFISDLYIKLEKMSADTGSKKKKK